MRVTMASMDTAVMLSGALAAAERRRVVAFAILGVWWAGDQCASASLDGVEPTAALPAKRSVTATALRVDSIRQTGILPAPARKATLGSTARKSVRESARATEHVDRMEKEMEELEELEEMEEMVAAIEVWPDQICHWGIRFCSAHASCPTNPCPPTVP